MTYKYSRKEIVNELKELGLYHDRLEEYILSKSTKPKSTPKPNKIEEIRDYDDVKGFWTKNKTNIKINEIIQVINYLLEKER